MNDYISRSDLERKAVKMYGFGEAKYVSLNTIQAAPAADVAPVVHATFEGDPPHCTHCGCNPEDFFHTEGFCSPIMNYGVDDETVRFCPGCGAIIDEEVQK